MAVNKECIFGTRPWKVFGEGPATGGAKLTAQGFNEGKGKPFTAQDVRFTQKGRALYAIVLGWPANGVNIASLGTQAKLLDRSIKKIQLLGSKEKIQWRQTADALVIQQPKNQSNNVAIVFKLSLRGS
jgi:alpha-L-fucosidase